MDERHDELAPTRRRFLEAGGLGLGSIALASLFARDGLLRALDGSLAPKPPPRAARAKQVIFLEMAGAPPQLDLFDYKPELARLHGTPCPQSFLEGRRLAFIKGHPDLLGPPHGFVRAGESGQWVSERLPHLARVIDRVALVRSMHTDQFNHAPADLLLFTGSPQFGAASIGSWVTYGLGTLNEDLPGYVVLVSGGSDPTGGKSIWSSGFLPSEHQGVRCRSGGEPILYVDDPPGMDRAGRRSSLDALRALNELELERRGDPETRARIEQYELAFRMQAAVPEVFDLAREPRETLELYGATPGDGSFATHCLLARRLVEAGVRFVQLADWGWDLHGTGAGDDLLSAFPRKCREVDRPIAALLLDLERRGLLEETLVVWGGEFGRTAMNERRDGSTFLGRDHHPDCFTMWLAGGGAKAGLAHGSTCDLGYGVASDPVSIHDLQATILHLLGLDAHRLSFPYQGLDQRLIGPTGEARVQHALLA